MIFLKKTLELLWFFSEPLEISKRKFHPWKFGKVMYVTSLKNFKANNQPRPLEISHEFLDIPCSF